MDAALAILAIFLFLVVSEYMWRREPKHEEFARKFIHISVGTFVAFWPYFLSRYQIILLSLAFLIVVAISRYFNLFSAIHSVQRPTHGEFWFALSVGILAVFDTPAHIFTAALLIMSLADGLAAVFGSRFGKRNRYKVLGANKSIVGTLTFIIVTVTILSWYSIEEQHLSPALFAGLSLGSAIVENLGVRGLDNLFLPLVVAFILTRAA